MSFLSDVREKDGSCQTKGWGCYCCCCCRWRWWWLAEKWPETLKENFYPAFGWRPIPLQHTWIVYPLLIHVRKWVEGKVLTASFSKIVSWLIEDAKKWRNEWRRSKSGQNLMMSLRSTCRIEPLWWDCLVIDDWLFASVKLKQLNFLFWQKSRQTWISWDWPDKRSKKLDSIVCTSSILKSRRVLKVFNTFWASRTCFHWTQDKKAWD